MNRDGENVTDLNPRNAIGSLAYVGGQPARYCVVSMDCGQLAVCTDLTLTSTIEAILEESNWADTKSTVVNFDYVTVRGIRMIQSIKTLSNSVNDVGSVTVRVPQPAAPIKAGVRKFIDQVASATDANVSSGHLSRRFTQSEFDRKESSNDSSTYLDSGVSDGATSSSANVSDPPSVQVIPGKTATFFPTASTARFDSPDINEVTTPRMRVFPKKNTSVEPSFSFPKSTGNNRPTGFSAFGGRSVISPSDGRSQIPLRSLAPITAAPTNDQERSSSNVDNVVSPSHLYVANDSTSGIIPNMAATFAFPFPTSRNSGYPAHARFGASFYLESSDVANSVAKHFPRPSSAISSSTPVVLPQSSLNNSSFATTSNNSRIVPTINNMSEQSRDNSRPIASLFSQSIDNTSITERPSLTCNPISSFPPRSSDSKAADISANTEEISLKSKFRTVAVKDLHTCDDALLHKIQNEWYYEPFMLNKLDYPFTTGGFIDKRNFSGSSFTFYSRRTGAIEIPDTEERKRKNSIYGYCMVMGPRNCKAWEFAKPPASFKSTKFLKRGAIEVKGYGILAAAGERNERHWLLWSDHLGLISCLPSAGRNIKAKYKDWTPTLQAVMFDAEEEGQWKVKNLSHVDYETMSKNKWFPDHIYFVNDVVMKNMGKGIPPQFYSDRLGSEINVKRRENVIDDGNDGSTLEAFVVFEWHTATEGEFFALAVYPPRYRTNDENSIFQKLLPHVHIVENWETDNVKCTPMENNARSRL